MWLETRWMVTMVHDFQQINQMLVARCKGTDTTELEWDVVIAMDSAIPGESVSVMLLRIGCDSRFNKKSDLG